MPFGRDTRVVLSNIKSDRGPGLPWEGQIWGSESPVCSEAVYCQITLAIVVVVVAVVVVAVAVVVTVVIVMVIVTVIISTK